MSEVSPITSATDRVFVTYQTFCITDHGKLPEAADYSGGNGLIYPFEAGGDVITGIHTGFVTVTATAHDVAPDIDLDGWEEGIEVSIHAPDGLLFVESREGDLPNLPTLSPSGQKAYRLRVLARGRMLNPGGVDLESVEEYLLIAWPAPPTEQVVLLR